MVPARRANGCYVFKTRSRGRLVSHWLGCHIRATSWLGAAAGTAAHADRTLDELVSCLDVARLCTRTRARLLRLAFCFGYQN